MPGEHKVIVVEDESSVRNTIAALLQTNGYSAVAFPSAEELLESGLLESHGYCCLVLDIALGGMSGVELFEYVRKRRLPHKVVFLSGSTEGQETVDVVQLGPADFVIKPNLERLVGSVKKALEDAERQRIEDEENADRAWRLGRLSRRELQVASRSARGCSVREIAQELGLAFDTVKMYRSRAMRKLGVTSAVQMAGFFQG